MSLQNENEASRAYLNKNKRIFKWRPFWNKVHVASVCTTQVFVAATRRCNMSLQHDPSCPPILKIIVNAFPRISTLCRYVDPLQNVDYFWAIAKDILQKRQKQGFPGTKDLVQLMLKAHEEHVDGVSKMSDVKLWPSLLCSSWRDSKPQVKENGKCNTKSYFDHIFYAVIKHNSMKYLTFFMPS